MYLCTPVATKVPKSSRSEIQKMLFLRRSFLQPFFCSWVLGLQVPIVVPSQSLPWVDAQVPKKRRCSCYGGGCKKNAKILAPVFKELLYLLKGMLVSTSVIKMISLCAGFI